MSWLLLVLGGYLLGSVSFSLLVVRALKGIDIRTVGSGNAGATNVLRAAGKGPAIAVLALDIAKGAVPVVAARLLGAPGPVIGAVAVAAVVGHVFPVFHGFRGGKGVATVAGALGGLALAPAGLAALIFLAIAAATRYVALASVVAVSSFPLFLFVGGRLGWIPEPPAWLLLNAVAMAILIVAKHHTNIRRLLAGTEARLDDPVEEREETA